MLSNGNKLKSLLQNPPCGSAGIVQSQPRNKGSDLTGKSPCGSVGIVQVEPFDTQAGPIPNEMIHQASKAGSEKSLSFRIGDSQNH
jgi:hypothetical protein